MRRLSSLLLALFVLAVPARAQEVPRLAAQIPLLRLADQAHADIDTLAVALWQGYYRTTADHSFGSDDLRAGRFDLDGDGQAELVLMVVADGWEADQGYPFVVARWTRGRWLPVGWGWGDPDTVFAATEVLAGWRTLVTNSQILRWSGAEYKITERTP